MVKLVPYSEIYFDKSFEWLNDPELRDLIDYHAVITKEQQESWFRSLPNDDTYKIWGIEYAGTPIGACGIKHIDYDKREGEYWGYIGEKDYLGGKGHAIVTAVLEEAKRIEISKVYLHVLASNIRAKSLYTKEGFVKVREYNGVIEMNKYV